MTDRAAPPTIRDVALRAGVSTATVSRVLAGIGNPRPDTAAAVTRAVEELGYRPSGVARSLRMKRTRTLGLVVADIQNPFFPELIHAVDRAARTAGYSILLGTAAYDEHRAVHYLDLMVDRRVDGLIIASTQLTGEGWHWLERSPVPVVVVTAEPAGRSVPVITSDNPGGDGRCAVDHLVALGHRRIAYIRGHPGSPRTSRGSPGSGGVRGRRDPEIGRGRGSGRRPRGGRRAGGGRAPRAGRADDRDRVPQRRHGHRGDAGAAARRAPGAR